MYSKIPGVVAGLKSQRVENTEFETYCDNIKAIIYKATTEQGTKSNCTEMLGSEYRYADGKYKFRFIKSDYGNDHYYLEINRKCWDNIPKEINPFVVNENSEWNCCFHLQNSPNKKVLLFHLPGIWFDELRRDYNY